jgi:hypothetical protein
VDLNRCAPFVCSQPNLLVPHQPYSEPTWLSKAYHSPYYSESHRALQKVMRKVVDEVIYPDAQAREDDNKYPSQSVTDTLASLNITAMRFGVG